MNPTTAVNTHRDIVARLKAMYPEISEDELADTIEGESDVDRVVTKLIDEALTREALVDGIKLREKALQERKARLAVGAEKLRSMAMWVMQETNMPKVVAPGFTASLGVSRAAVIVTDESLLPRQYGTSKWTPDKKLLGDALKGGVQVPGAELSNLKPTITVRTS